MLSGNYLTHYKRTFLLAYPVCLSQLGHIMVGVVDTAMAGYVGTEAQAAVALANSIFTLILVFAIGFSFGITPPVAAADGNKDQQQITLLLSNGLLINLLLGILLFAFLSISSPLLHYLNQPESVVEMAIPFFNILMLSLIPITMFATLKQFTEGLSYTKMAMIISIGSNLLNILLNYVFIFGKAGIEPMGIMGSCWATFISRTLMAIGMLIYLFRSKHFRAYREGFSIRNISVELIKKITGIGIPSGFQFLFEVGAFSFAAIMVGWLGTKQLAAHQIALSLASITYMIASGVGAAATVRVGNYYGKKNKDNLRTAGLSALIMVMVFMTISAITFVSAREWLPSFFSNNAEVKAMASSLLIIAALFQLSDGIQVVGLGALRGIEDVRVPTYITLISYWVIALPGAYLMGFTFELGIKGIWYGLMIGLSVAAILLFTRFYYKSR